MEGYPASQGTDAAILEGRVWPQGDVDGLFVVRRRRRAFGGRPAVGKGHVDDPDDHLRRGQPDAAWDTVTFWKSSYRPGARAVNSPARRCPFAAWCQGSNTVTFGEVFPPPRNSVAFLLTARREIVAARDRRKSANHATLRATRRLVALSVFNAAFDGPNATPRVTSVPPQETLKLSASLG